MSCTTPANRTLVAYWGVEKPPALATLLRDLQQRTSRHFGSRFKAYATLQMHATLIGLESIAAGGEGLVVSQHALDPRPVAPLDEVWCVHEQLLTARPMTVRFGRSASSNRYRAAFQVGRTSVIVVGWPLSTDGSGFDDALWQYRNQIGQKTGYVHKYAREKDNDFYVVLGRLRPRLEEKTVEEEETVEKLEHEGRRLLAITEVLVDLPVSSTMLVEYQERTLPLDSTRVLHPRKADQ